MNLPRRRLQQLCRGRTRQALADEIGVSRPFLAEVMDGVKPPGPRLLAYLGLERYVAYRRVKASRSAAGARMARGTGESVKGAAPDSGA